MNTFFKNISKTFIYQSVGAFIAFLLNIFLTRNISQEDYGIYTLGISWLGIFAIFSKIGLDTGSIKFLPEIISGNEKLTNFYKKVIGSTTILSLIILIISIVVLQYFNIYEKHVLKGLIIILLVLPFRSIFDVQNSWFQFFKNFEWAIIPRVIIHPLLIILSYKILTFRDHTESANIFYIYSSTLIIIVLLSSYSLIKNIVLKAGSREQGESFIYKSLFKVSFSLSLVSGIHFLYREMDVLMLSWFLNIEQVALYGVAVKINLLLTFGLAAVNYVIVPEISKTYNSRNFHKLQIGITRASKVLFVAGTGLLLTIIFFGKFILSIFGPEYKLAFIPLLILSAGQFVNTITGPVGALLSMTDLQILLLKITIASLIINIILNLALIPFYGLIGAAVATAISTSFRNITCTVFVKKRLNVKPTLIY